MGLDAYLKERVETLIQSPIRSTRTVSGGYTKAHRLVCETDKGPMFLKVGVDAFTNMGLQREIELYRTMNLECMPRVLAADSTEQAPILVLEDLSHCRWPPPWQEEDLSRTLAMIHRVHETKLSEEVRSVVQKPNKVLGGWQNIAQNPEAFLATGLVSSEWLKAALPKLVEAERACCHEGKALVHFDLRSDNLCIGDEQVYLIDWNWAQLGNPTLDLGFFINTVCMETGRQQEIFLQDAPAEAASLCGFFADQCGRTPIPGAPRVRALQRAQCLTALPWLSRLFNLSL